MQIQDLMLNGPVSALHSGYWEFWPEASFLFEKVRMGTAFVPTPEVVVAFPVLFISCLSFRLLVLTQTPGDAHFDPGGQQTVSQYS